MSSTKPWCVYAILVAAFLGGCDSHTPDAPGDASIFTSSTAVRIDGSVSSTLSESGTSRLALAEVPAVFRDLAESMRGIAIFSVAELPDHVQVVEGWWPILEGGPESAAQHSEKNPHVVGEDGSEPEGQLLLSSGGGWLAVLENFRGDLGEVSGEIVTTIVGRSAYLYEVNGGWLVQWEYEGRWYGVFGRDVDAETVVGLAAEMALLEDD